MPQTHEQRRHALAFNALSRSLDTDDRHVPLGARQRATTAVMNALTADLPPETAWVVQCGHDDRWSASTEPLYDRDMAIGLLEHYRGLPGGPPKYRLVREERTLTITVEEA